MMRNPHGAVLSDDEARELCILLEAEDRAYRRLLRLARRQNRYLRRHDLDRLENNAREWGNFLPTATAARRAREIHVATCAERLGLPSSPASPATLLDYARLELKQAVRDRVQGLLETTTQLARQNELNGHLTRYCLDLVQEESEIFRNYVLEDPAGRYGDDAQRAAAGPGGVLVRQA
jgi:hypothetical protein